MKGSGYLIYLLLLGTILTLLIVPETHSLPAKDKDGDDKDKKQGPGNLPPQGEGHNNTDNKPVEERKKSDDDSSHPDVPPMSNHSGAGNWSDPASSHPDNSSAPHNGSAQHNGSAPHNGSALSNLTVDERVDKILQEQPLIDG